MMEAHDNEGSLGAGPEGGDGSSWGPVGPDGRPTSLIAPPPQARLFTGANVPCLRDCRHYMVMRAHFDAGNPAGTFAAGYVTTERNHICLATPGTFIEMSADAPVYECNRWDPFTGVELQQIEQRRERHYDDNPDHRPIPIGDPIEEEDEEDEDESDPGDGSPDPDDGD